MSSDLNQNGEGDANRKDADLKTKVKNKIEDGKQNMLELTGLNIVEPESEVKDDALDLQNLTIHQVRTALSLYHIL